MIACHLKCRAAAKSCEERNDCRSSTSASPRRLALLEQCRYCGSAMYSAGGVR
ncbi:MAG: hypothetical protein KJ558_03675 [Gammaproteobacteria bacterium]|nr:hypothetical protein [Gammaproteobacteria bacterium]MBU1653922.1 hypothetical protein [Gammaproteobacteria bacterium]MBU1960919.1 hypothetical protein [Gammaproteobacteria bacterium]